MARKLHIVILLLSCLACLAGDKTISLTSNPDKLRKRVRDRFPKHVTVEQAQRILEQEGFRCGPIFDGLFDDFIANGVVRHTNVNYLDCTRLRSHVLGQTSYIIALPHDTNMVVTNVWVQVWKRGLLP
jgi:hypothetical protein